MLVPEHCKGTKTQAYLYLLSHLGPCLGLLVVASLPYHEALHTLTPCFAPPFLGHISVGITCVLSYALGTQISRASPGKTWEGRPVLFTLPEGPVGFVWFMIHFTFVFLRRTL